MIASHNSWTFRRPVKWWMRLLNFMGRCQSKCIHDQLKLGITLFDLRIRFHDGAPHIHHGFFDYGELDRKDLKLIYDYDCGVRILLESNSEMKDQAEQDQLFSEYCDGLLQEFKGLKLYGGRRKYDWKKITSATIPGPVIMDGYSSATSLFKSDNKFLKILDDWIPVLYAFLKNENNLRKYKDIVDDPNKYLMYDFV